MKVLFTGASSFTGFWFVGRLAAAGAEIVAPLRGAPETYEGVRAERVRWLSQWARLVPRCAFGEPAFLDLIRAERFDVLCHHGAESRGYREPVFDVAAALSANTRDIAEVFALLRERGCKAVVATGSVFEADEGAGPSPRRAFSPYGLSKGLTWQTLKYWGEALGLPVSKFVIANPFGPYEEPRFVNYVVGRWAKGEAAEVRTPNYLRDNIHVDLLAMAYAQFVTEAGAGGPARRFGPCGYMETQGAFAERLGRELAPRLGLEGRVVALEQTAFDEPLARLNADFIDAAALGWREDRAWDALAGFYRQQGFGWTAKSPSAPAASTEPAETPLRTERPPPPPTYLQGAIDVVSHTQVSGWLTDRMGANPRFISVSVDNSEQGALRADLFRKDLRDLKISDGHSGYRFAFSSPLDPYCDHVIQAVDRDSGRSFGPLPAVLKRLVGAEGSPFGGERDVCAVNVGWAIYEGDKISLLLEAYGRAAQFGLPEGDAAVFEVVQRTKLEHRYYQALGIEAVRTRLTVRPHDPSQPVAIRFAEAAALDPGEQAVCANLIPGRLPDYVAGVEKENMERVSGPGEQAGRFAAGGLATAYRIDALVRLHFGRALAEFGRCLDWGAGAGRVAAPMARIVAPGLALTATDIDVFNVEFGRGHYPDIDYVEAPFTPPAPFEAGAFGAIYGVSVFTHLTESVQFAWLAELRRLVRPGAPVVVSVHNDYAALLAAETQPEILTEIVKRGLSDIVPDGNLGPKLREKNYYRATFHARRYILETWTREFEILKIYPCGNGSTQDFVVMRAK